MNAAEASMRAFHKELDALGVRMVQDEIQCDTEEEADEVKKAFLKTHFRKFEGDH